MDVILNKLINNKYIKSDSNDDNKIFAVKIYQNDLKYLNDNYENITDESIKEQCFIISASFSNFSTITFIVNKFKIDVNVFTLACYKNTNLDIIKYLANDLGMDVTHTDNDGNNGFTLACMKNTNLDVIKYLVNDLEMDVTHTNNNGGNGFTLACYENINLDVIKYLVNDLGMDMTHTNKYGNNGFTLACYKNTNLDVIKYLVNDLGMDINHADNDGYNGFTLACYKNTNLDVIKCLVNDLGMDINHTDNDGYNGFTLACYKNTNINVIKYLVIDTKIKLSSNQLGFHKYIDFMKYNKNTSSRVAELFNLMYDKFNKVDMINIIKLINPILLDNKYYGKEIKNPFNSKFNEFKILVDQIDEPIYKEITEMKTNSMNTQKNIDDYTTQPKILFECNGDKYYGYRNTVYESILLFKDIINDLDFDEVIKLDIVVPKYIINCYINSCYTENFDMNNINSDDLMLFLNFIDRYPTTFLSINLIEQVLITYLKNHNIEINIHIKELCERYQLKYLYIYIHNQEMKQQ
jgi:NADH:ubiquinone oxidoreductase subunit E